jgi:glutamyl-tRNA synthetase
MPQGSKSTQAEAMPFSEAYRTRFAPSPTGAMHLGHARTHLVAFLRARALGGRIVMRIEDIDPPRA